MNSVNGEPQTITTPYSSYILRLWHAQPNGTWRATLKDVRDGTQLNFTSIKPLVDFLVAQNEQKGDYA